MQSQIPGVCLRVVFCLLMILVLTPQDGRGDPGRYRLLQDLFQDYNPIVRPVYDPKGVTYLNMQFYVSQVLDMDERMQRIKINAWVTLTWQDELLTWNVSDYGVDNIKIPSDIVWLPEVVLYNNADDKYESFVNDRIIVIYSNGEMMWASPVIFISNCQVDATYFPFDSQECEMKFGPWQYDGTEIKMNGTGDATVFRSDGEWDMKGVTAVSNIEYYPDHPGVPYYDVTYTIQLQRRPVYYIFNLIVPCVILAALSALTFLLPVESGEKISYGISVLLALTVFLLLMAETLPPSSVIPLVGQYHAATVVLVTLSLITSVFVINIHHRGDSGDPLPDWMKRFIIDYLGRAVYGGYKARRRTRTVMVSSGRKPSCLKYIECSEMMPLPSRVTSNGVDTNVDGRKDRRSTIDGDPFMDSPSMKKLISEVKRIGNHLDDSKKDDETKSEWILAAVILDRFFLSLYTLASILTIVVIASRVDWTAV
ncbi:neuronal acetylcholine receptor subunit alpha-10-like isoform X2 [Ptychodera flava]|uniref:neuronal acetylcholine receptor subunit alpha-10-like isoform X2 n=1 Tax=Ptychodera flava TaxID=63121 RepID=UPI00396A4E37